MKTLARLLILLALVVPPLAAQSDDGFQRERRGESGAAKDALEGKTPPALVAENWMNSEAIDLASLKGKVVVLDFWGTW